MDVENRVLAELSEKGYSSGEAISRKLHMTRSAVWKHVVKLRQRGYVIEASPRHGYRLAGRPDKLLAAEIQPRLSAAVIGSRIVHLEKTGSTADVARRLIGESAPEGTVVIAEAQTRGRGRLGRSWQTPAAKTIAMSVILYPSLPPARVPLLSLGTAVAVRSAIHILLGRQTGAGVNVALKWPNDIYLEGRKLGGVLLEMSAELDRVSWAIDSIGVNVNNSFKGTGLEDRATSLFDTLGHGFSRRDLAVLVIDELDRVYRQSRTGKGLGALAGEFESYDMLQGRRVEVTTPDGAVSGVAAGIDSEGRLNVKGRGGRITSVFSGEASLSGRKL